MHAKYLVYFPFHRYFLYIFVANKTTMSIEKLYNPAHLKQLAQNTQNENKKWVQKIKAKKPRQLDALFHKMHEETFEKIDCLQCANCCKGLGPHINEKDIERLSKYLRMKPTEFIQRYLKIDEDQDSIFKEMPCPFLLPDNYCMVYDARPKACRDYPHTDHKKMIKYLNLALKNVETCPAVYLMLEDLKKFPLNEIK